MTLTKCLKSWLVQHTEVPETASDDEFVSAATKAIADGSLTPQKLAELTKPDECADEDDVGKLLDTAIAKAMGPVVAKVGEIDGKFDGITNAISKAVDDAVDKAFADRVPDSEVKATQMFGGADDPKPNVIEAAKQYDDTKSSLVYPKKHPEAGRRAQFGGLPLDSSSELDLAIAGAYFKFAAATGNTHRLQLPRCLRMTDHDKQLMDYAIRNCRWTGVIGGKGDEDPASIKIANRKLNEFEQKALIDDSTSGGLEAAPIVFDAAVITTPVLYGELFPLVSVMPLTRGRRVEGFSIGNPTFTDGTAEGTAISTFSTDAMIAAFDTTIYNAVGAIEIGNDFEEDSPVAIGAIVTQRYGEKALEWLDSKIANGSGSAPTGLFQTSGITDIGNPAGGAGATAQIDDFESLLFNVAKQYRPRSDAARCVFLSNDTSYQRARAIPVGAADERRVFGMDEESYELLGHPYKVQNDLANTVCGFYAMKYYRMYRRLGLTVRVETGGKELATKNLTLIVVRMRWGGQLELGGAGSYSDNWAA